ncbi:MAG: MarR family winged helix-turn-helix transcriptional regulator [Syntrophaceticus sp.]|nr:MarR family winged helix-turn-helix transcriptional regulator [Syntrophaceticus sp.]MDD3314548.1 MarR family winged helix-turn-helix transcriptional regulator [Syntrophaceticus sp.]MDD4359537.1 MarR family winged helix-turn-helix transcriptional regulator [Syntrophaceticus sp.]MDD4782361.1 MarR family winged helix-turn-helix transcriptional regulator [Syntrophaceticus sp.]
MNNTISDIYNLIQELSWYFGNQGFDGECCGDLSLVEFMALKNVHIVDDITIQEIGNALNITKSGASKVIDRLENKGYVFREQSSTDGRVCCVTITGKGKDAITNIEERYSDYVGEMLIDYEPDALDNVKNVLSALVISVRKQGFIKPI